MQEKSYGGVIYLTSHNVRVTHAFTTRFGGISRGIYESLNLGIGFGDEPGNVAENFGLICSALGISDSDIVCSRQVHGAHIRTVSRNDCGGLYSQTRHEADGLITCDPGVALAVFTADCVPILLHDPVRGAIGAVHAGWRGTAANIAGAAVKSMTGAFGCSPADISVAIGPCISKCCYETDRDVADAILEALPEASAACVCTRNGKYMVDLKEANRFLLYVAGIQDVAISDECTSCRKDKYWSHRRTSGHRGSQAGIIVNRKVPS